MQENLRLSHVCVLAITSKISNRLEEYFCIGHYTTASVV
jgi:hypothetical protein